MASALRARVGCLSLAVLAHEAEGDFAAVGGGDGEEVGDRERLVRSNTFLVKRMYFV